MVNVVCELLNRSKLTEHQGPLNIANYVHEWGGGLKKLKQCYPQWDDQVNEACKITGIGHKIWRDFVNMHDIPRRDEFDPIHVLQHLLQHWVNIGAHNRNYGPYPSVPEQQQFAEVCLMPMQHLQNAIIAQTFEPCFRANNLSIPQFIERQRKENAARS